MARRLRADGLEVIEAENGDDALDQLGMQELDLLVMDVRMPGRSGLEVAYLVRTWRATTPVVLVTAYPEPELFDEVDRIGATLLAKPFAFSHLSEAAMAALGRAA
jgi:CheY-like chemotaxis protein